MVENGLSAEHFVREDDSDDRLFYETPRLVTHIDAPACAALARFLGAQFAPDGDILDLMSSCVSHLPEDAATRSVIGLGMNAVELRANPRLTGAVIHDLNAMARMPFADNSFDGCSISVSVQYLTRPIEVFAEIGRVLRPGSRCAVSFSNRMFPTKAVALWRGLGDRDHARLVDHYFNEAGGFDEPRYADLSPNPGGSDPLFAVSAAMIAAP